MSNGQWPEAWVGLTALYSARWNNGGSSSARECGKYAHLPTEDPDQTTLGSPPSSPNSPNTPGARPNRKHTLSPGVVLGRDRKGTQRRESLLWEEVFLGGGTGKDVSSRLDWVESPQFQSVVGGAIGLNALVIGFETDAPSPYWFYVETSLLMFFLMEIVLRILKRGWEYFQTEEECFWNWLDFLIVVVGIVDQWLIPLLSWLSVIHLDELSGGAQDGETVGKMGVTVLLLRIVRILRIMRLLRLVKVIRPLYHLSQGLIEAVQGMFWVLVVMTLGLYVVAILCTRLLGHGIVLDFSEDNADALAMASSDFATVPLSMYMLFECTSGWTLLRFQPLFEVCPFLRVVFILFYVFSAWTLLAVMVGVVSENMIAIREQAQRDDEEKEEARRMRAKDTLVDLFHRADVDGSGEVSKEEFDLMLQSTEEVAWLRENMKIRLGDLTDLFEVLDEDGSGEITVDEFIGGFRTMNEPLTTKSLMKLEQKMKCEIRAIKPPAAVLRSFPGQSESAPSAEDQSGLSAIALNELATKLDKALQRLDELHQGHHRNEKALVELTKIAGEAVGSSLGVNLH